MRRLLILLATVLIIVGLGAQINYIFTGNALMNQPLFLQRLTGSSAFFDLGNTFASDAT